MDPFHHLAGSGPYPHQPDHPAVRLGQSAAQSAVGAGAGTIGGIETLNGKPLSVYDSNSGNGVGHTFSIPTLGISVPLIANPSSASNICSQAPCSAPSSIVNIIKASFVTPGAGEYPWQCFVPCGLGWLYGNGGPMSTLGYMGGFLDVVA